MTLHLLYHLIGTDQMQRLLNKERLKFCPAMSLQLAFERGNKEFSRSRYISMIEKTQKGIPQHDDPKEILQQLDSNLLIGPNPNYLRWEAIKKTAINGFEEVAARSGYEFLYPVNPFNGSLNRDRRVGLEIGLARISDLAAAGITDIEMDNELMWLLDISFPGNSSSPLSSAGSAKADAARTIEKLHCIKNLPPLGQIVAAENWSAEKMLDVALSDEADELRDWLGNNLGPGVDVRDAYIQKVEVLPSKKAWAGWLRFGTINSVTTTVGALIGNPVLGASIGLAISALDQQFGQKTTEAVADPYHPKEWLSLSSRGYDVQ